MKSLTRSLVSICVLLLIPAFSFAQEYLYGITQSGGAAGKGVVYRVGVEENDFGVFYDLPEAIAPGNGGSTGLVQFDNYFGFITEVNKYAVPYNQLDPDHIATYGSPTGSSKTSGMLIPVYDGRYFGQTWNGGDGGAGTIYTTDFSGFAGTIYLRFDGPERGKAPKGNLVIDEFSNLYGMTELGGANDKGVIFTINTLSAATFRKFLDFNGTNGANPVGSLVLASDGFLYGMTKSGGQNNFGVVFKIAVDGTGYKKLLDFDGITTGSAPLGSLVQFTDGKLYGTTSTGGANDFGTVFGIAGKG